MMKAISKNGILNCEILTSLFLNVILNINLFFCNSGNQGNFGNHPGGYNSSGPMGSSAGGGGSGSGVSATSGGGGGGGGGGSSNRRY